MFLELFQYFGDINKTEIETQKTKLCGTPITVETHADLKKNKSNQIM